MAQTKKAKLNGLVTQYKATGDETYFGQAFALCAKHIEATAKKYARNWKSIPVEDFISEWNLRFYRAVQSFDSSVGDFENVLNRTLRNAFVDLTRNLELRIEYTPRYQSSESGLVDVLETTIIDGMTRDAELEAHDNVLSAARNRVLASLLEVADATTLETIVAYVETGSFAEAGRKLGVAHTTVKRRIESLESKYDYRKFGSIHDYMGGGNVYAAR